MRKISLLIIKVLMIMIILQPIATTKTYAGELSFSSIFESGRNFLNEGKSNADVIDEGDLKTEVGKIYNILFIFGVIVAVLVGAILGVKFILGSIDEQAKIKEVVIPYVAGCIVIFGAFGIWRIIIQVLGNVSK